MAKQTQVSRTDNKHYFLIGYLVICVSMIFMTLLLAFTPQESVEAAALPQATSTVSPLILTRQADYAPVSSVQPGSGQHRNQHATETPAGEGGHP